MYIHNPPIYLTQHLLSDPKLVVTKSKEFLLLDASYLEKNPLLTVLFLGIFRDSWMVRPSAADSPPYKIPIPPESLVSVFPS